MDKGFNRLQESSTWSLQAGGHYFFCRSDSTLVAFIIGDNAVPENGARMVGAHTDGPCLKIKTLLVLRSALMGRMIF